VHVIEDESLVNTKWGAPLSELFVVGSVRKPGGVLQQFVNPQVDQSALSRRETLVVHSGNL
jgi:hypothetical protein